MPLYDVDILAWSEQQAAALRRLAELHDLPNGLDLANVVEEIESVGRSEFRTVESLVENILVHLILIWADPNAPAVRGWRSEVIAWRLTLRRWISPSMRAKIDMQDLWQSARKLADARLRVWDEVRAEQSRAVLEGIDCPVDIGSLCDEEFDAFVVPALLSAGGASRNSGPDHTSDT